MTEDEDRRALLRYDNPFAVPAGAREPARRLRGRLPAPVTIWTAGSPRHPAGLTVSSVLVAEGDPPRVLGLLDPLASLWDAIRDTGMFVVRLATEPDRELADRFSGARPGPGGPFGGLAVTECPYGPLLPGRATWAGCRLVDAPELGYHLLVQGVLEQITVDEGPPLVHLRGRYRRLQAPP